MTPDFIHEPHPDHPGWMRWELADRTRFNALFGKMIIRRDEDGRIRMRAFPARAHSNLADKVHGGALLGLIDIALFATLRMHGVSEVGAAVTLDLSTQFIGGAAFDRPLDLVSEVLRETRRLAFIRGLAEQDGAVVASYAGTVRKASG